MNEEGVSQVIGTILLVAITVIVAAIITSFLFGSAGNVDKTKTVAATAGRQEDNSLQVTYHGGPDAVSVTRLLVYDDTENVTCSSFQDNPKAGSTCVFIGVGTAQKDHVRVVAIFSDADPLVILDTIV